MTLNYDSTLDDITEPSTRVYLRSKSAQINRIKTTLIVAIIYTAIAVFLLRRTDFLTILLGGTAIALVSGIFTYFNHPNAVKKRIRRYMQRETEGRLPCRTVYTLSDGKLICESLGVSLAFSLMDLDKISEDNERLEISFGKLGLCIIPFRAFSDTKEKALFVAKLNSEQLGAPNNSPRGGSFSDD